MRNLLDAWPIPYQESIYGGNVYLFTVELQQKDSQTVQVSLRRLEAFKGAVEGALESCSKPIQS